jgi:membrane protease YdiL (CAAX protease family)
MQPRTVQIILAVFGVALFVASQVTLTWEPSVGVYLNTLTLAYMMALALRVEGLRGFGIGVSILPLANMVTISFFPSRSFNATVIFYMTMLLLALLYRYLLTLDYPTSRTRLGKLGYGIGIPIALVSGQIIGAVGYLFLHDHYLYTGISLPTIALYAVTFAVAEEMVLRGLIQQRGIQFFGARLAALLSMIVGVALMVSHTTVLAVPVAILLQIACAATYYRKQNLLLTITLNATAKLVYIGLVATFVLH